MNSESDIRDTLSGRVTLEELMGRGIAEALGRIATLEEEVRQLKVRSTPPVASTEVKLANGMQIRASARSAPALWTALALGAMALAAYAMHVFM